MISKDRFVRRFKLSRRARPKRTRAEFAREGVGGAFALFWLRGGGEEGAWPASRARTLDVYLTRSNLIKNLIKSDFWAAPESVPNQPRRSNKTRKGIFRLCCAEAPPSGVYPASTVSSPFMAPLRNINVSRVSNLSRRIFFFRCLCSCYPSKDTIWNCNANNERESQRAANTRRRRLNNTSSLLLYAPRVSNVQLKCSNKDSRSYKIVVAEFFNSRLKYTRLFIKQRFNSDFIWIT